MDEEFERRLEALKQERQMLDKTETEQSMSLFQENLVPATFSIVNIALHSPNDKLRFDAAKYIVERNLGRLGDPVADAASDPMGELMEAIVADLSNH